ncbi:16S rRNA (adenine(1518)-N(6)/adenine(1519)-N(6))-dimethyltransferase, partial [Streptomyces sp. NPDC127079]
AGSAANAEAALVAAGVSPQARGESLTVAEFARIAESAPAAPEAPPASPESQAEESGK